MAAINDLLRQVPDLNLRTRLETEIAHIAKNKKFGIVFEEHIPECTPLYDVTIRQGLSVALKTGIVNDVYTVLNVTEDSACCINKATSEMMEFPLTDLVAVAQFGEPIFPTLTSIDSPISLT